MTPLRVLLVDDDPAVREVLSEYLTADGHEAVTAENGRDGLRELAGGRFDVIVTDAVMPSVSGEQLASVARGMAPGVPIVLLTGFGSFMESATEKPPGVDLVVGKPVTLDAFRHALATVHTARRNGPSPA